MSEKTRAFPFRSEMLKTRDRLFGSDVGCFDGSGKRIHELIEPAPIGKIRIPGRVKCLAVRLRRTVQNELFNHVELPIENGTRNMLDGIGMPSQFEQKSLNQLIERGDLLAVVRGSRQTHRQEGAWVLANCRPMAHQKSRQQRIVAAAMKRACNDGGIAIICAGFAVISLQIDQTDDRPSILKTSRDVVGDALGMSFFGSKCHQYTFHLSTQTISAKHPLRGS